MYQDLSLLDQAVDIITDIETLPTHELQLDTHEKAVWNQGDWRSLTPLDGHRCSTGLCVAGWICELDPNVRWAVSADEYLAAMRELFDATDRVEELRETACGTEELRQAVMLADQLNARTEYLEDREALVVTEFGTELYAQDYVRERLGLNEIEAFALFSPSNSLARIKMVVGMIRDGEYREEARETPDFALT